MKLLVILLIALLAGLLGYHLLYRRQVADICRQLAFMTTHETNQIVTLTLHDAEIRRLAELVNRFSALERAGRLSYQKKDRRLKRVIANISHDIRTPLTSLDGYFQLLAESGDEAERARYQAIIHERILSLTELLEQLFLYTKLQNEDYLLETERVNLGKLLSETLLSFYDDITGRGITPQLSFPEEELWVFGNEPALRRVFQNVIKNALVHGQGYFSVTMTQADGGLTLHFTNDTLPGAEPDPEQVFDRFYKADASRTVQTSGLGLSIARELMERMHGSAEASLEDGRFCILLRLPGLCAPETELVRNPENSEENRRI